MSADFWTSAMHGALFGDAEIAGHLSDEAEIGAMIRVEAALARAEAGLGVIPEDAGLEISSALAKAIVSPDVIGAGVAGAGVGVPALIAALRPQMPVPAAAWLHWGATSQDVIDTAMVLRVRDCLDAFGGRLDRLIGALEAASRRHESVVMAGRTRSQIATPITFGLKAAQWAQPLIEAEAGLSALRGRVLRVQFGGASGANTAVAPHGPAIAAALAAELGLADGPPWHVNRGPVLALGAWAVEVTVALSKIAGDLVLLGRSEIAEVAAGAGGGSSTMPQKSNPVAAETMIALAQITAALNGGLAAAAAPAEERDGARWAVEWALVPQMMVALGVALRHAESLATGMTPDAARMRANLTAGGGAMAEAASFALAAHMPRAEAQALVKQAAQAGGELSDALPALTDAPVDWARVFDPDQVVAPCAAVARQIFARRGR